MTDSPERVSADLPEEGTLAHHLAHLAADADDVVAMLSRPHAEGGDIHPEALPTAERLQTSLHDVLHALADHEHLAMSADDVWKVLTRKHQASEISAP